MAKSLGYGKISLTINNFHNIDEYLKEFELNISSQIENWANSEEIKELLTMATEQDNKDNSKLEYMKLEDFSNNKTKLESLKVYSKLDNIKVKNLETKLKEEDKDKIKNIFEEDRKIIEAIKLKNKELIQMQKEWEIAKVSNNIELLKNFILKYPNALDEIELANKRIEKIIQENIKDKQIQAQQEAEEKWNAIQKVDLKFKQKALEDFITNYPNSDKIEFAKKELESFSNTVKSSSNSIVNLDDLKNANDGKKVKSILDKLSNIDENQKIEISNIIKDLYPSLKAKEQKSFFKDAQIGRFIGKDLEDKLKNILN